LSSSESGRNESVYYVEVYSQQLEVYLKEWIRTKIKEGLEPV
jgi:hypothetical protein